jgi:hypothetical protein
MQLKIWKIELECSSTLKIELEWKGFFRRILPFVK